MLYNWNFKKHVVLVGGFVMQGFDEGDDVIQFAPVSDRYADSVGADGEVTRDRLNDDRADFKLRFKKTSPSLQVLSAIMAADILDDSGIVPILVKALPSLTVVFGGQAWIMRIPDISLGQRAGAIEWPFRIASVDVLVGGATRVGG
jgi:hypothetical protein